MIKIIENFFQHIMRHKNFYRKSKRQTICIKQKLFISNFASIRFEKKNPYSEFPYRKNHIPNQFVRSTIAIRLAACINPHIYTYRHCRCM